MYVDTKRINKQNKIPFLLSRFRRQMPDTGDMVAKSEKQIIIYDTKNTTCSSGQTSGRKWPSRIFLTGASSSNIFSSAGRREKNALRSTVMHWIFHAYKKKKCIYTYVFSNNLIIAVEGQQNMWAKSIHGRNANIL